MNTAATIAIIERARDSAMPGREHVGLVEAWAVITRLLRAERHTLVRYATKGDRLCRIMGAR
jgi:hypothetical protein